MVYEGDDDLDPLEDDFYSLAILTFFFSCPFSFVLFPLSLDESSALEPDA